MENSRYKASLNFLDYARLWTPTGAQTISKAPERFPLGAYPIYLDHGQGTYVWDVDGNKFLDMICGLASLTLGYRHPRVDEAIRLQLDKGISFSLPTKLESELAERLCGIFPCGHNGSARFVKTGSESNESASRIARRATGRDNIVVVRNGYHSWHSVFSAVKELHPGAPKAFETVIRGFTYNDLPSLAAVLDDSVAAVMLEPTLHEKPNDGFLEQVKVMAHAAGALLIFDEVICAGRWAHAGGQEYFDVIPDIATAGKGLANGMPLGCVIGSRDLMKYADVTSGTFNGEALSLAACNAVLDIYQTEPIIETLWKRGEMFQQGFNAVAQVLGIESYVICDGFPVKPRIRFLFNDKLVVTPQWWVTGEPITQNAMAMSLFLQETAVHGILWHPAGGNVSAAMTAEDIEFALTGMAGSLVVIKYAINEGDWSILTGQPIQSSPMVRKQ